MIRIKAMYCIVSTPSRKKGQKASPLQNQKGENRQPYGNACLYSTRSFQWAQQQNREAAGFPAAFLRREAPLRRGYFKSMPQAHRNSSLFSIHSSLAPASQGKTTDAVWRGSGRGSAHVGCHGKNRPRKGVPGRHNLQSDGCGARAHCVRNGNSPGGTR